MNQIEEAGLDRFFHVYREIALIISDVNHWLSLYNYSDIGYLLVDAEGHLCSELSVIFLINLSRIHQSHSSPVAVMMITMVVVIWAVSERGLTCLHFDFNCKDMAILLDVYILLRFFIDAHGSVRKSHQWLEVTSSPSQVCGSWQDLDSITSEVGEKSGMFL